MRHQLKHRWMRAKKHTHTNSEKQRLGLPDRGESKSVSAAARKAIAGIKCLALPSYIVAASNGKKKTKTTKWASAKDSSAQQHHPAVYSLKKARDSQSHTRTHTSQNIRKTVKEEFAVNNNKTKHVLLLAILRVAFCCSMLPSMALILSSTSLFNDRY